MLGYLKSKNRKGDVQYKHQFSRIAKSWVAKKIQEKKDEIKSTYKSHIMNEITHIQMKPSTYETPKLVNVPKNVACVEKPDKAVTVPNRRSRFVTKE